METRQSGDRFAALYELEANRIPLRLLIVWRGDAVTEIAATPRTPSLAQRMPRAESASSSRQSQQWLMAVAFAVMFAVQAEWPERDPRNGVGSVGSGSLTIDATRDEWARLSPARAHTVLDALTAAVKRLCGLQQPDRPERPIVATIDAIETQPAGARHPTLGTNAALAQITVVPDRWVASA